MPCAVLFLLCNINIWMLAIGSSCSRELRDRVRVGIVSGLGYHSRGTEFRLCGQVPRVFISCSHILHIQKFRNCWTSHNRGEKDVGNPKCLRWCYLKVIEMLFPKAMRGLLDRTVSSITSCQYLCSLVCMEPNLLPFTALHFAPCLNISKGMSAFCEQGIHRVFKHVPNLSM